jgi:hypothetical protein
MKDDNLSHPSLIPNLLSTMKGYGEKKKNLRMWALKSSNAHIVKTIVDDLSQQEQSRAQASASLSAEYRRIAVFGASPRFRHAYIHFSWVLCVIGLHFCVRLASRRKRTRDSRFRQAERKCGLSHGPT